MSDKETAKEIIVRVSVDLPQQECAWVVIDYVEHGHQIGHALDAAVARIKHSIADDAVASYGLRRKLEQIVDGR